MSGLEYERMTWIPLLGSDPAGNCGHPGCSSFATAWAKEDRTIVRCDDQDHRYPVVIGSNPAGCATFDTGQATTIGSVRVVPSTFEAELRSLLNKHSREGASDTPDYALARFLTGCLASFDEAMAMRRRFWGQEDEPFKVRAAEPVDG